MHVISSMGEEHIIRICGSVTLRNVNEMRNVIS